MCHAYCAHLFLVAVNLGLGFGRCQLRANVFAQYVHLLQKIVAALELAVVNVSECSAILLDGACAT